MARHASSLWLSCCILELCVLSVASALEAPKLYDCEAEADIWEWAWTPDWKAWCCEHESKGCPPTTTQPTTQTSTATETLTPTLTQTGTETATETETTTTKASTVTHTVTSTETVTTTRTHSARLAKKLVEAVPEATTTPPVRSSKSSSEPKTNRAVDPSTDAPTSTSLVAASTLPAKQAPSTVPSTDPPTTSSEPDLGCNSDCVILGESATCQARISWVEKHQTNEESAPCPAAHVVVMSQCAACGTCLFKDVECATKQGVSKLLDGHTFMYKYSEDPVVRSQLTPQHLSAASIVVAGIVPLAIAAAAALRYRRWLLDRELVVDAMDGDLVAAFAEE